VLEKLYISNFLLIDEVSIDFHKQLNVLVGETGSGKSIIIDAISILFGDRVSADLVRNSEKKTIIEGTFKISNSLISDFLNENEIDDFNDELIIRKEFNSKLVTRSFINDTPVNISTLKELKNLVIDFHSQHGSTNLLNREYQQNFYDNFIGIKELTALYRKNFTRYAEDINKVALLKQRVSELQKELEYQKREIVELKSINPKEGEIESIKQFLSESEKNEFSSEIVNNLLNLISSQEAGLIDKTIHLEKELKVLAKVKSDFESFAKEIESTKLLFKELSASLTDYLNNNTYDPLELEEKRQRLKQLNQLEKRYGNIAIAIEMLNSNENIEYEIENTNLDILSIELKLKDLKRLLTDSSYEISEIRKTKKLEIENEVIKNLNDLGIKNPQFEIKFTQVTSSDDNFKLNPNSNNSFNRYGQEELEFYISTNKGFAPTPLKETASGGEISRIMLSFKNLLAITGDLSIFVFDEIDTGIGGEIAIKVADKIKQVSSNAQVLCITHLPQIASKANNLIKVAKHHNAEQTQAEIKLLTPDEKLKELSRMLSGKEDDKSSLELAKVMLSS
jgi:DNA repair protein RecN (Recombination protein N)